ncbi:MAG: Nramp family divalent metal transporter [Lawsonibacter sp.]
MNETKKPTAIDYLRAVGPAIVISAVVVGPGSVTTASSMGANYSYKLLWVIVLAALAAFFYQLPAIRVALAKEVTIMEAVRIRFGKAWALVLYYCIMFGALIFQAGNFTGAAMAMNYFVPQIPLVAWAAIMIALAFVLVWTSRYGILENFTKVLVILMVVAFVATAIGSSPSPTAIVSEGFSFQIPNGDYLLVLAMLATTMVPDIPVSLSALHKQRYFKEGSFEASLPRETKMKMARFDLVFGCIITALITSAIVICSATNLFPLGITVSSAADMASQLTPILGRYAGILFSLGLWAAAFSSGMFRIELLPLLYNQATDQEEDMKATRSRVMMILSAGIPLLFILLFGKSPAQLVVMAQALNGLLLPVICGIIWRITSDKKFMGEYANRPYLNTIFAAIFVVTVLLAVRVFLKLIA